MNSYSFQVAEENNIDEILELFENTIRKCAPPHYSNAQINAWASSIEDKPRWINKIRSQYFIMIKRAHHIVGFGSIEKGYIDMLYVHHNWLRKGVASYIFDILKRASNRGGHLNLRTHASKMAVPFFESKGFTIIKENKIVRNDEELINFEMILKKS